MALCESLSNAERGAELELTLEQAAELDRRWVEHVQRPQSARVEDDGPEPGALYSTKACRWPSPTKRQSYIATLRF